MPEVLHLPPEAREAILDHCIRAAPAEACGLVAVSDGAVRAVYPTGNDSRDPERAFVVPPADHYRALLHAESRGWHLGGSFHSHPRGEARPSPSDVTGALDPDWYYLVVGLAPIPAITAWRIRAGEVAEVSLS
ncbi:MAG TPA: M67 family metallopeptidase [Acidimicrobiia bacterium]